MACGLRARQQGPHEWKQGEVLGLNETAVKGPVSVAGQWIFGIVTGWGVVYPSVAARGGSVLDLLRFSSSGAFARWMVVRGKVGRSTDEEEQSSACHNKWTVLYFARRLPAARR